MVKFLLYKMWVKQRIRRKMRHARVVRAQALLRAQRESDEKEQQQAAFREGGKQQRASGTGGGGAGAAAAGSGRGSGRKHGGATVTPVGGG